MFRALPAILLLSVLTASSVAQQAGRAPEADTLIPLSRTRPDLNRLRDWGRAEYLIHRREPDDPLGRWHRVGSATLQTTVKADGGVSLQDEILFEDEGRAMTVRSEADCRAGPTLPLVRSHGERRVGLEGQEKESPDRYAADVTVHGDEARRVFDRNGLLIRAAFAWPADAVADAALLRLVCLLPREPGKAYDAGRWFRLEDGHFRGRMAVRAEGPKDIWLGRRKVPCFHFTLWKDRRAWSEIFVGPEGIPERIVLPGDRVMERTQPPVL